MTQRRRPARSYFADSDAIERTLDFLAQPLGLDADDVSNTAIEIDVRLEDGRAIPLWVMNPERCLRSRVANSALPEKQTALAWRQLRAAMRLVRAYGLYLLDHAQPPRVVYKLNERIFELAFHNRQAMEIYLHQGIDVLDALVDDERLCDAHRETRLPQIRAVVTQKRDRHRELAERRAKFMRLRNESSGADVVAGPPHDDPGGRSGR